MSIVKGGTQSQLMVKALQNDWGRRLFSRQIITAIGESIYKVGLVYFQVLDISSTAGARQSCIKVNTKELVQQHIQCRKEGT